MKRFKFKPRTIVLVLGVLIVCLIIVWIKSNGLFSPSLIENGAS